MMEDNKMECTCKKEDKGFCVVYTIEAEERHVVVAAKNETDAIRQLHNALQIINSVFGLNTRFIIDRVYQEC